MSDCQNKTEGKVNQDTKHGNYQILYKSTEQKKLKTNLTEPDNLNGTGQEPQTIILVLIPKPNRVVFCKTVMKQCVKGKGPLFLSYL